MLFHKPVNVLTMSFCTYIVHTAHCVLIFCTSQSSSLQSYALTVLHVCARRHGWHLLALLPAVLAPLAGCHLASVTAPPELLPGLESMLILQTAPHALVVQVRCLLAQKMLLAIAGVQFLLSLSALPVLVV